MFYVHFHPVVIDGANRKKISIDRREKGISVFYYYYYFPRPLDILNKGQAFVLSRIYYRPGQLTDIEI